MGCVLICHLMREGGFVKVGELEIWDLGLGFEVCFRREEEG